MAIFRNIHDPGLGEKYLTNSRRIINKDGTFNVERRGIDSLASNLYFYLINMPWWQFFAIVFTAYVLINCLFGFAYVCMGVEYLKGAESRGNMHPFFSCMFFSFQTFTSVGYGGMVPQGFLDNAVASAESFLGLVFFALVTGLLYGRFSKPKSKVLFSKNALVSPYKEDGKALMFRIANRRHNVLMEMEASIMLMCLDLETNNRKYYNLKLEVDSIRFFALNWTIVHPLTEESPLYGINPQELKKMDAEILILLKGFDDTFGQTVYQRHSYKYDEVVFDAKFAKPYDTSEKGHTVMDLNLIHVYEKVSNAATASMQNLDGKQAAS